MRQMLVALLLTLSPTIALGQVPFPKQLQTISSFSFEAKDWGIEATATPKRSPYHAPTPTSISGGRVIKTLELKALLDNDRSVVVIDVLESKTRNSVPGAFRMFGAGGGEDKRHEDVIVEGISVGQKAHGHAVPGHRVELPRPLRAIAPGDADDGNEKR